METQTSVEVQPEPVKHEQIVYTLDNFIELIERFMLYQEQIEVNLPAALHMLALEIKHLKSCWEVK